MDKHKYLVIYRDNEQFEKIEAKDIVGCVIEFARFMGKASLLMLKALKACDTAEECCAMYNRFVSWYDEIDAVYEIDDPMFQKMEKIAEMLGVEFGEKFKVRPTDGCIPSDDTYMIDEAGSSDALPMEDLCTEIV